MAQAAAQSEQFLSEREADERDAALLQAVDQAGREADAEMAAQAGEESAPSAGWDAAPQEEDSGDSKPV